MKAIAAPFDSFHRWIHELESIRGPLLFGLRLWASVCLALFVAFWLQLDDPFWAGISAAVVCQPHLGASFRKSWFRLVGTAIGSVTAVVATACFADSRAEFLLFLAMWCAVCVFAATMLRNFASYAASLAGYTTAIIAVSSLGATGGISSDVFLIAVWRATEISIGIIAAALILSATDTGDAQRRLKESLSNVTAAIAQKCTNMLALAGSQIPDTRTQRQEFLPRIVALDPLIDDAIGESSYLYFHSTVLQQGVFGLFASLEGWQAIETHLSHVEDESVHYHLRAILSNLSDRVLGVLRSSDPTQWTVDAAALAANCDRAVQTLSELSVATPSIRLLADETAKILGGFSDALRALALLSDPSFRPTPVTTKFSLITPDALPAVRNGIRTFVTVAAVEAFWIVTAWPSGTAALEFVAILLLLISPYGEKASRGAIAIFVGSTGAAICAAVIKFALLPVAESFSEFCLILGPFLMPAGFALVRTRSPAISVIVTVGISLFVSLLAPTNPVSYDPLDFYNTVLALIVANCVTIVTLRLLPPVPSDLRARRLLALSVRDLRRVASGTYLPSLDLWRRRAYAVFTAASPEGAVMPHQAQLLATLSAGASILELREMSARLGVTNKLEVVLSALLSRNPVLAGKALRDLDNELAAGGNTTTLPQRARARTLSLAETIIEQFHFFAAEVRA